MKIFLIDLFLSKTPFLNQGDLKNLSTRLISHYFLSKISNFPIRFFKTDFPFFPSSQFSLKKKFFLFLRNSKKHVELISNNCLLRLNFKIIKIAIRICMKKKTEKRVFKVCKKINLRKLKKFFLFGFRKIISINIFKGKSFFYIIISDLCFFSKILKNKVINKAKNYFKSANSFQKRSKLFLSMNNIV